MIFLFNYDYTLDEGGVETSDESNQQEVANNLARLSIEAVARLGGYKCECVRGEGGRYVRAGIHHFIRPVKFTSVS